VPAVALCIGNNVLAVEVHQALGLTQGGAMLFYTPGPSPATARLDGPYTVGSRIRVGATAQQLTHLGVQDADAAVDANDPDGADGLTGYADDDGFLNGAAGIQVGIWNGAGTLLASASVVSTDPHFAGWRYKAVTPITLAANTDYFIGTRVGSGLEWFLDSSSGTPPFAAEPGFSLTLNTFATGASLLRPATDGTLTIGRWGAANALLGAPAVFTVAGDTTDAVFAARLTATENQPVPAAPALRLNEVSLTGVELMNTGVSAIDLTGASLRIVSSLGTEAQPLPGQSLGANGFLAVPLPLEDGSRVVLLAADGLTILDSAVVKLNPRGRFPDGSGPWLRPAAETSGAANSVTLRSEIVINEIMYDHPTATLLAPGSPQAGQWIEIHNRSTVAVDLSEWKMDRGIGYTFAPGTMLAAGGYLVLAENPTAFHSAHALPAAMVYGPWSGNLSHGGERLVLEDADGNPADEVSFSTDGRWPSPANAGGSSLELRDARADNSIAESWAASDETGKAAWQTFTWRMANIASLAGEPTLWRELNLLLVDGPGEFLVDDIRVTDTTTSTNLIANGDFSSGVTGWRLLGNHRNSVVEQVQGNPALHVIASGPGEYQGNQIEATYIGNQALVANREYEVSLRARWLSGGGRVNVRQYFNRLARTHLLSVVSNGGTPGAVNSRAVANAGPGYRNFSHSPAMPAAGQAVVVSVDATDADGMAAVNLKYSVNGGAWQTVAMALGNGTSYSGTIPGQAAGTVQFYLEGHDTPGALSNFPSRGAQSRALYSVQDGRGAGPLQKVRLIMTPADATFMHTAVNTLSNEELGATVIVNDRDVYYDIGVRLKGSFVGRNVVRVGFNLLFNSDRLFRGVHGKVAVDRSQHATVGGVGEIIAKHLASAAGGIPNMYDDLAQFVHPSTIYSGMCQLRMAGFEKEFLDTQYPNGGDGTMFEMEVFRWNLNTVDGNPASPKLPGNEGSGTGYLNIDLGNYGTDKEIYRWFMLQTMGRDRDDYTASLPFTQMFSLTGTAFDTAARQRLDYDAFLRTMAYQSLVGPADAIYTGGAAHNCRFYFRPHDGRAVYMPWDWDSAWQRSTSGSLIGSGNLAKIVTVTPDATRRYYCHLYDIIQTAYNPTYMTRWTQHYGNVSGQDFFGILNYIAARRTFVLGQLPTATVFTASAGTPNANGAVTLTGNANIQVAFIEVNGLAYTPVWTSNTVWSITLPLLTGPNALTIRGLDKDGLAVAGATASLNVSNPNAPGWPAIRINEWLAENDGSLLDPADGKSEDWLELHNPTTGPVDLSNWSLSDNPSLPRLSLLPAGTVIPAGGFLHVWADNEPAQNAPGVLHVGFKLNNAGETIGLYAPDSRLIDSVRFGEQTADDAEGRYADGAVGIFSLTSPTPGAPNVRLTLGVVERTVAGLEITFTTTPGRRYRVNASTDFLTWTPLTADTTATGTTLTVTDPGAIPRRFYRAVLLP
jgi:hypothetical protein